MSDVWQSPTTPQPDAPVAALLPSPTDPASVARTVWADLQANPLGYAAAGLCYLLVVSVAVTVIIGVLFLGVLPGLLTENETLIVVGGMFGFAVYIAGILVISLVVFPMMAASLMRTLDAQLSGGPPIGFWSPLSRMTEDWVRISLYYVILNVLAMVGMMLFYVPGLIVMALGAFATPMVVLEGRSPTDALGRAWEHAKANPAWHVGVWLLLLLVAVAAELTVVGVVILFPVLIAWQLAAHRAAFGRGGA